MSIEWEQLCFIHSSIYTGNYPVNQVYIRLLFLFVSLTVVCIRAAIAHLRHVYCRAYPVLVLWPGRRVIWYTI